MIPVLVVAAAIVDDLAAPRQLLTARRTRPPTIAGRWELPGGKVEPGETPVQALHRELAEELGVTVRLGSEVPGPAAGCWPITRRHVMRVWAAQVVEGEPRLHEGHDELRWLPPARGTTCPWLDGDLALIAELVVRSAGPAAWVDGGPAASARQGRLPDPLD